MQVLRNKSPEDRQRIIEAYNNEFNANLKADLADDLSSHDLDRANALMEGNTAMRTTQLPSTRQCMAVCLALARKKKKLKRSTPRIARMSKQQRRARAGHRANGSGDPTS